jgi:uncharacterized protein (DUF736 family)
MIYYTVNVPVAYEENGQKKTTFRRVGAAFENKNREGETFLTVKLDFPVGATELVCFLPKAKENGTDGDTGK